MAPTASGVLVGFGIFVIFLQGFNYLVDSYLILYVSSNPLFCSDMICTRTHQQYSAASVFANSILWSAVGAAFPILASNVPGPWGSVGRDTIRLLISGHDPDSTGIYILRAFLAEEE